MYAFTHVAVEPGLQLCTRTFGSKNAQLFHPLSLRRHSNYILHALAQFDTSRISHLYHHPKFRFNPNMKMKMIDSLELHIDVISTQTMLSLPQAHNDEVNGEVVAGKRYRCFSPGLEKNATDILAFTDPLVEELLLSSDEGNEQHNAKNTNDKPNHILDILIEDFNVDDDNNLQTTSSSSLSCGSLALCPGQMLAALGRDRRRCNEVGTMEEYLLCALTHSILHLFGYKHGTMEERDKMVSMEKKVAKCVAGWLS